MAEEALRSNGAVAAQDEQSPAGSVRALSSPDRVVQAILTGIDAGRYVPGQRLIEADLTNDLKVSRGPVREALKRLAAEGVVTLTRHRGAYVRALSRREVQDTLTVLEALTGLMTRLAAANIDESDNRARLVSVYNALMHFQEDGDNIAFIDQRRRFYDTLIEIGGNRELKRIMPLMQVHLLRLQFQSYQSPRERARQFEEYQAVGEAVLSGDPKLAERTMRLRVRRTRNAVNKLPDTAFPAQA